ncbi:MAG: response regulator [Deltaproteobacteria bacterium]|nr:response regulator [Deltaproteobacteria bacterium]
MKSENIKILITNGAESAQFSPGLMLTEQGYRVETAGDGLEALEKVETFNPDLILLNLTMSGLSGIECCHRIKSNGTTNDIKVIMISSSTEYSKISKAFAAGCDDYIVNPIDRSELLLTVRDMLKFSHLKSA